MNTKQTQTGNYITWRANCSFNNQYEKMHDLIRSELERVKCPETVLAWMETVFFGIQKWNGNATPNLAWSRSERLSRAKPKSGKFRNGFGLIIKSFLLPQEYSRNARPRLGYCRSERLSRSESRSAPSLKRCYLCFLMQMQLLWSAS